MYHSVEQIEAYFGKIKPKYWIIREKDKNGTPKFTSEHGTFEECLTLLPAGIYNISMRSNANATKDAPNYTFQYGEAVQGIGNTVAKEGFGTGQNWGANSMMGMVMMMMQENNKQHQALLMQLQNQQVTAIQAQHAKDMELFKLQMKMKNDTPTIDKIMGVVTNPNAHKLLEVYMNGGQSATAALGRLTTEGSVPVPPPPVRATAKDEDETTEVEAQSFDPDTLTPEQRAMYDKGIRINNMVQRVQEKYPDGDPIARMEMTMETILAMDKAKLMEIMMHSPQNDEAGL